MVLDLDTRHWWKLSHLELDSFEENEEGGAGVVLHVVVQAERLQTIHNQRDANPFQGI